MRRGTKTRESDPGRTLSWPGSDPAAGRVLWVKMKSKESAPLRRVLRHKMIGQLQKITDQSVGAMTDLELRLFLIRVTP